ncbi:DUF4270 family protein [Croceitalea rosinachiae]|uniref:DUF4270 family protein n=1 Tax=Croceitalea rosinachiae TaxID=3075596 RepID=A0ABU3A9F0_9FLAO|nr:DUF4270 family protein [Croceitalea sp. F388]MDT0606803.1 DUF4270 family protein [Croceitalea sp. F388]
MKKLLIVFSVGLFIVACSFDIENIPTLEVGQEFVNSEVRVLVLDTFTVKLSTFRFDSINSSSTERLLVGQYNDQFTGKVRTESYFELTPRDYELPNDAELDSVALILGYDNYFYGDTTLISKIGVHQLEDRVNPDEDFFYNTSRLNFDPEPLASINYRPEPFDEDSLHISIPIEFGRPIFEGIRENEINNDDDLREFFYGFTLQPDANDNTSIIGFSRTQEEGAFTIEASSYLRFFYTTPQEFEDEEDFYDLIIQPSTRGVTGFNHISNTLSEESSLTALTKQEDLLPSIASGDLGYIQSGTGYALRVEFPTIRRLFEIEGTGTILSAELQLKPPTDSYNDSFPIRGNLNVGLVDNNNETILTGLLNDDGNAEEQLIGQQEEFSEVLYEISVGTYIDTKLNETTIVKDALLLFTQQYNNSVDRVILQGEENMDFEATLTLTYAIYEE